MKFGPVPLDQAEGAILAHSLRLDVARLPKGHVLTAADIATLRAASVDQVTVARLDAGDIQENAAAHRLAQALAPDPVSQGLRLSGAGAGRVNLIADRPGIVRLDVQRLHAINAIEPMITVATLPDLARVDPGTMLATIKIISYAVPQTALDAACADAAGALRVSAPVFRTATLIETTLDGDAPDKGRRVTQTRLERLGLTLTDRVIVRHDATEIAAAVQQAPGQVLLILTASATSDAHDTAPEGLRAAGGQVVRFGMPVDPGNLLFLGHLGDKPVLGLPGCARSPALNGADWVLERVVCGIDIGGQDIAAMGVGGLLKEIPSRPRPRRAADAQADTQAGKPGKDAGAA
ncbi:molybdopterin-binding protein [Lacimonas salitolerans]|uniref:Molybdopterin-binding protein n=1 Tax=Lacimonas salitolerans TaxID=1323750 RepID=A0ABW4EFU3_9RHOB